MPIVRMPDGTQVRFPDDMPREQIRDMIATKFPDAVPNQPQTGFERAKELGLALPGMDPLPAPEARHQSMVPGGDTANAFARGFGENIPIVGPLVTGAADAVGSRIASMITGRPVEEELAAGQGRAERDRAANPTATTAGAVAGSVGPLMSIGTTQLGGRALGLSGPLWQRVLAGGASGAGIAAGDAAARGEGGGDITGQGALGLGIGATLPLAERAISPIARMIMGQPSAPRAVQSVATNLEREGIDPAMVRTMLDQQGPDAVLADLGPNLTRQAGAIASLPGEGQTVLRDALVRRQQGSNARIQGQTNEILGPATTPRRFDASVRSQQQALSPEYERAFANATRVDTAPIALDLDSAAVNARGEAQSVARQLRDMLNVIGTDQLDPNPRTLFEVRKAIDGMFDTVQDGNARRLLGETRRQVDNALAQAVPGIKAVDSQFANLAQQRQAFEDGMAALDSGRTSLRPEDLQDVLSGANGDVLSAFSQGTRSEIDRLIGTTGNNIQSLRSALKGDGSWNRSRLAQIFGQERADRLIDLFERELTYNRTYNTVLQNSETAARTAAQKEAAPHQFGSTSTSLTDILLRVPQAAANAGARTRSERVNRQIAEMLVGRPTPEIVDQLIAARRMNRGLIGSSAVPLLTNQ